MTAIDQIGKFIEEKAHLNGLIFGLLANITVNVLFVPMFSRMPESVVWRDLLIAASGLLLSRFPNPDPDIKRLIRQFSVGVAMSCAATAMLEQGVVITQRSVHGKRHLEALAT